MSGPTRGAPALAELLARVAGRIRRGLLIESSVWALTAFFGALALGTALLLLGVSAPFAGLAAAGLWLGGLLFALVRSVTELRRSTGGPTRVAAFLDRLPRDSAGPAGGLLDASELERDGGRFGASPELARAAVQTTLQSLEPFELESKVDARFRRRTARMAALLATALLIDAALFVLAPRSLELIAHALTSPSGMQDVLQPPLPEPRLGEFRLDYRYPEYAARPPRTRLSSSGDIHALAGTEVTLEVSARNPLREAVIVMSYGDALDQGGEQRIAAEVEGRRIRGRFVVTRAGRYRLEVVTADGGRQAEREGHLATLEPDNPPDVRLLEPEESPIEVNANAKVPLRFEAKDDFALGKAQVAWRILGTTREGKLPLTEATSGVSRYAGKARFDLRGIEAQPGDRVAYSVEVFDNDTISGPKVGASETKELRIYSKRSHHAKASQLEQEALDKVIHILGDHLEGPYQLGKSALLPLIERVEADLSKARQAVDALEEAAKVAKKDPLGRENLDQAFHQAAQEIQRRIGTLARNVDKGRRRRADPKSTLDGLEKGQIRMIGTLERQAVYLSDLLDEQRMLDAEALTRQLREQQSALRDALQAYQDNPSAEARERIMRAIEDIRARMSEIMSELAELSKQIPTDFVNMEANLEQAKNLDEVAERIESGDMQAAMEALDRMLGQTERMLSQLQEGRKELQTREYSEITKQAEKLWEDLSDVRERQRDLAKRTDEVADAVRERSRDKLDDAKGFVETQKARLQSARDSLTEARPERHMPDYDEFESLERRLQDSMDALDNRDFGATNEMLEEAIRGLDGLDRDAARRADQAERFGDVFGMGERAAKAQEAFRSAKPPLEAVQKALKDLVPDPSELLSADERRQLGRYQKEQQALSEKALDIQQGLEKLGEQLPLVGPEVRAALDDARGAMGASGDQLGRGDAPGAAGQERRAVEALERLAKQLEEMGSQSGGGQGGAGIPLPFGQPSGNQQESERGGSGRFNRDKVEIPKPEAYQAPSEFREDIIEAAKDRPVDAYREAVRRYYEELVK